jgi:ATP-dependent DNA helicase RecG
MAHTFDARPCREARLEDLEVDLFPNVYRKAALAEEISHRNYESNAPVRFHRFAERLEIDKPGGLYGDVSPANFPRQTDCRNPIVAEALEVLGYVNRFGRGLLDAQEALRENGNPPARYALECASQIFQGR